MRGLEIARENRLPYVQFVESAGADLEDKEEAEKILKRHCKETLVTLPSRDDYSTR